MLTTSKRNMRRLSSSVGICSMVALFSIVQSSAAQVVEELVFTPDVTVEIDAIAYSDEVAAYEDFGPVISPLLGPTLPIAADLNAYHLDTSGSGSVLFSPDITVNLGGSITVTSRDVGIYDFNGYLLDFDGAAAGVPAGTRIDAIAVDPVSSDLVLSFDTTVELGGSIYADEDLVGWDAVSFYLYLDGSTAGIPATLDVDGATIVDGNVVALSFDGTGKITDVDFDDEDILIHYPAHGSWYMAYDASSHTAAMTGGPDINGIHVPEPGVPVLLAAGVLALSLLNARRRGAPKTHSTKPTT